MTSDSDFGPHLLALVLWPWLGDLARVTLPWWPCPGDLEQLWTHQRLRLCLEEFYHFNTDILFINLREYIRQNGQVLFIGYTIVYVKHGLKIQRNIHRIQRNMYLVHSLEYAWHGHCLLWQEPLSQILGEYCSVTGSLWINYDIQWNSYIYNSTLDNSKTCLTSSNSQSHTKFHGPCLG